jgi:DNA helicase-2/ATP-dependent DNA helicase PcrA
MTYTSGKFTATPEQESAIVFPPKSLMILAGAGTGKTSTLIHRIRYQIGVNAMDPDQIVILTFTEKATAELKNRFSAFQDIPVETLTITTFHAFCNLLVRNFSDSPDAEKILIQENDTAFLLLKRYDELTFLTSEQFRLNPAKAVRTSFLPFFNRIRDELISPENIDRKFSALKEKIQEIREFFTGLQDRFEPEEYYRQLTDLIAVYKKYQEWKQAAGFVDYGDMVLDCWRMLNTTPAVLRQIQDKYRHFIIDEYQDNNYALNRIVHLLADRYKSITVVGDEDQCIYSFRGANYYNIQDFRNRYGTSADNGEIKLTTNFRSTAEILDLANTSIRMDANRTPKDLIPFESRHGEKPIWHIGDKNQTLPEIISLIKHYVFKEDRLFGDIAILCRSVSQVKTVADTLEAATIPTDVFVERFFSLPIIRDILAWFYLCYENPHSEAAFYRLIRIHLPPGVSTLVSRTLNLAGFEAFYAGFPKKEDHNPDLFQHSEKLVWLMDKIRFFRHRVSQKVRPDELLWDILQQTGLLDSTRTFYRYRERVDLVNVGHLLALAEVFSTQDEQRTIQDWVQYLEILNYDGKYPALKPALQTDGSAVKVMTIHQSKGLEFPIVVIPFLRSGSFPSSYRKQTLISVLPEPWYQWKAPEGLTPEQEHFNEERRIFYVAITRAREKLHLFGPEKYQSKLLKEITEPLKTLVRRQIMPDHPKETSATVDTQLQRLMVELNRELAAGQWENARTAIDAIEKLKQGSSLGEDHPYAFVSTKTETETPQPSTQLLTLSASAVEEYSQCPYKYRLAKIDKIPERKSLAEMEFGNIIHKVLQQFHSSSDQSLERLLDLLESNWKSQAFEYLIREEEFHRQGKELLSQYYNFVQANPPQVVGCELPFEFIIPEIDVRLRGQIDRIDEKDGKLDVIDYKTGNVPSNSKTKHSLQLALYVEALNRKAVQGVTGEPGKAILLYLKNLDEPLEPHEFSAEDLEGHLSKVKEAAAGIRANKFEPNPNDFRCQYCDYRHFLCPAWESD